jgi:hypothetical protein
MLAIYTLEHLSLLTPPVGGPTQFHLEKEIKAIKVNREIRVFKVVKVMHLLTTTFQVQNLLH